MRDSGKELLDNTYSKLVLNKNLHLNKDDMISKSEAQRTKCLDKRTLIDIE